MNLANSITLFRIILAPVFFVIYLLPRTLPSVFNNAASTAWIIPVLWILYIVSEITDYFDGLAARKLNLTSDFGKLFDPFADTLVQLTFFLCFVIDRIFPAFLFLIIIYREFGILFLRNLFLKKGATLGARMSGKIKTVSYIVAVGVALLVATMERGFFEIHTPIQTISDVIYPYVKTGAMVIYVISVSFAVLSFIDYIIIYFKTGKANDK